MYLIYNRNGKSSSVQYPVSIELIVQKRLATKLFWRMAEAREGSSVTHTLVRTSIQFTQGVDVTQEIATQQWSHSVRECLAVLPLPVCTALLHWDSVVAHLTKRNCCVSIYKDKHIFVLYRWLYVLTPKTLAECLPCSAVSNVYLS